ncbi:MAG: TetR/AcrR family transcriptional regulator, partial [Campylobacterales bacterium]|nr:TetR/AcrR family transcriptional regulator [Campylobacterales bacterium]
MQDTRTRLIEATFQEVFSNGYKAASLSSILKRAESKKGAMYHYFSSKKEMVIAMIEEKIALRIENKWQKLLKEENILDSLIEILRDLNSWDLINGCPLGNLLQ